jgi:outer membrane lipoprotein-sorting protein
MRRYGAVIKILFFCLGVGLLWPAGAPADDFAALRRDAARIRTISADFVQQKHMKILSRPLVSEGRFYFAAPDSIRWEYNKPLKSIVLSSGGNTRRYFFSGGKIIEDTAGGAQAMGLVLAEVAAWMKGEFDANPSFAASVKEGADTVVTMKPAEKNMAGMIEKIEITLSRKEPAIKTVRIVENASTETRINFSNMVINQPVNPSLFQEVP